MESCEEREKGLGRGAKKQELGTWAREEQA